MYFFLKDIFLQTNKIRTRWASKKMHKKIIIVALILLQLHRIKPSSLLGFLYKELQINLFWPRWWVFPLNIFVRVLVLSKILFSFYKNVLYWSGAMWFYISVDSFTYIRTVKSDMGERTWVVKTTNLYKSIDTFLHPRSSPKRIREVGCWKVM